MSEHNRYNEDEDEIFSIFILRSGDGFKPPSIQITVLTFLLKKSAIKPPSVNILENTRKYSKLNLVLEFKGLY